MPPKALQLRARGPLRHPDSVSGPDKIHDDNSAVLQRRDSALRPQPNCL